MLMKIFNSFSLLLFSCFFALGLSSFTKEKTKKKKTQFEGYTKIENGSYLRIFKTGTGKDSVETDGATFIKLKFKDVNDSVFIDVNKGNNIPSYPLRIDKPKFKGDFIDIIKRLHVGDSASFFVRLDSLHKYFPQEFTFDPAHDTMKYLGFAISIDSIYSKKKLDDFRTKMAADEAEKQLKMQKLMAVMQPIRDSAEKKEPMLRENDFALLSDYIKTQWKGPKNPDDDGIFYMELVPGTGPPVTMGSTVAVRYTGKYLDGTVFDANTLFKEQEPLTFRYGLDQMIPGFTMCVGKMRVGSKSVFILPSRLGYKDGLTRIFEVEIISIK
jgi:FKBP-type peptidyl-prolyl cis-trans isomerase